MKKIITFIYISLFCILSLSAQGRKESREKIKALKIAYLTEKLSLTPNEAEKFWPIYNANSEKQHLLRSKLRSEIKKSVKEKGTISLVSENDAERLVLLRLTTDEQAYKAHQDFIDKVKKVITYKKIIQLQLAEMEFGRKLMNKYKHKRSKF